jgi:hypothetical protein
MWMHLLGIIIVSFDVTDQLLIYFFCIHPILGENGRNMYRILVEKLEGKRPLGTPRRRSEDNIKMDLGEIGWDGMKWIHLAQDRDRRRDLVNTVMNLRVP